MAPPKALADLVDSCLGPTLAAQGFAAADVVVAWSDIVGARLADFTRPIRIDWPRRKADADADGRAEPATLVVRVESAFALEMQHLAPVVMERINAHYGWRCIGRIVLKQGPVHRPQPAKAAPPRLDEAERQRLAEAVEPIAEDDLRGALDRLGQAVIGGRGREPRTKA